MIITEPVSAGSIFAMDMIYFHFVVYIAVRSLTRTCMHVRGFPQKDDAWYIYISKDFYIGDQVS